MKILRCEMCQRPCTLNMLDDKPINFCPVTGEKVQWMLVNKKWREKPSIRQREKPVTV